MRDFEHGIQNPESGNSLPPNPLTKPSNALQALRHSIEQWQAAPADMNALNLVRQHRFGLGRAALTQTDEQFPLVFAQTILPAVEQFLQAGVVDLPWIQPEIDFLNRLVSGAQNASTSAYIRAVVASMLYLRANRFPLRLNLDTIPDWLLESFIRWVFYAPQTFMELGEADLLTDHYDRWMQHILRNVKVRNSQRDRIAAMSTAAEITCLPWYFTDRNLKSPMTARAQLIEIVCEIDGPFLNYCFGPRAAERKVRIGVINGTFSEHTETFATLSIFENLDKNRFETYLYATKFGNTPFELRCKFAADKFTVLDGDVATQVGTIRADDLDLMVFGYNLVGVAWPIVFVAAHRLARIQVNTFCSPATCGFRNMDYFLTGEACAPLGAEDEFTEEIIRLSGPGFGLSMPQDAPANVQEFTRQKLGVPDAACLFVSGANMHKITPEQMDLWARVLANVPDSVLLLYPFGPAWSTTYAAGAFRRMCNLTLARHDVSVNRLIVRRPVPARSDVKALLKIGDVYLDSIRHSGCVSLMDVLELAVPPVVFEGAWLRARQGAAMLRCLGLDELVATNLDQYERLAVELARDATRRFTLSAKIARAMAATPVFLDSARHATVAGEIFERLVGELPSNRVVLR